MKTKSKVALAVFAALAMFVSCSKESGNDNAGGDTYKPVDLMIMVQMPQGAASTVTSIDITADKNVFDGNRTQSVELTDDAVEGDVINISVTVPADETTNLLIHYNAPETAHSVYSSYVELGTDVLVAAQLQIDATMSASHAGKPDCAGTSEDPYLIADKYQLQSISTLCGEDMQKYFKILDDIDLAEMPWVSIDGNVHVNGNGKTIFHLSSALFNDLDGVVKDLTISDAKVTGDTTVGILANTANSSASIVEGVRLVRDTLNVASEELCYAGALVGEVATGSSFDNCHIEASVINVSTNKPHVGGAFGYVHNAEAKIGHTSKCTIDATSTFKGMDNSGGFIGVLDGGSVKNCEASCSVEASTRAGGFVGQFKSGLLEGDTFAGTFTGGYQNVGGLVGEMLDGTVKNCSATSGVTYTSKVKYAIVGGLVGNMVNGKIESCFASGKVEAFGRPVGGLVGMLTGTATIEKSHVNVDVEQKSDDGTYGRFTGGFIGQISSTANVKISNCYATGTVTSKQNYNGAFIGNVEGFIEVTDCYTKTTMSGNSPYSTTVFAGQMIDPAKVTLKGFIGWDISGAKTANVWWYGGPETINGNKIVTDIEAGTISFQAIKFKWDTTVWNLSEDDPVLRPEAYALDVGEVIVK